ncbi:MAG: DUF6714 family protein [Dolichospermum sp.]
MKSLQINSKEVKKRINSAFANIQLPSDEYLLHPACQDESEIEDFKGRHWQKWQDIPQEIIDYNYSSLSFLSPSALRFFLPAYMIYGLDNPNSNVLEFTVYKLIAPNDFNDLELRQIFFDWVSQLSSEQKTAITLFLKYIKQQYEQEEQYISNDANEALQNYWENCHFYDSLP